MIISLAFPDAVGRVYAHLARSRFEDEPIVIPIFGHILPAEHIAQKRPRGLRVIGVNQSVNGGDRNVATELSARRRVIFLRAEFTGTSDYGNEVHKFCPRYLPA